MRQIHLEDRISPSIGLSLIGIVLAATVLSATALSEGRSTGPGEAVIAPSALPIPIEGLGELPLPPR